jgi:hypothetical protein
MREIKEIQGKHGENKGKRGKVSGKDELNKS